MAHCQVTLSRTADGETVLRQQSIEPVLGPKTGFRTLGLRLQAGAQSRLQPLGLQSVNAEVIRRPNLDRILLAEEDFPRAVDASQLIALSCSTKVSMTSERCGFHEI